LTLRWQLEAARRGLHWLKLGVDFTEPTLTRPALWRRSALYAVPNYCKGTTPPGFGGGS